MKPFQKILAFTAFVSYYGAMRIFLVEDNEKLACSMKGGLEDAGFAVTLCFDGLEAEKKVLLERADYDLVILDRLLPGKDGLSVAKAWRTQGIAVPILMLTALDSTDNKVDGLYAGADDYLPKPFEFKELIARIHALLRRPKISLPAVLTIGQIRLDTGRREVSYKKKEITLTLKEYMMLEYLMRNHGKVVPRDTLYAHAWDFADMTLSNTVDVHMKNLRKKLHDTGKIIQTIRGIGYKI